jgi:hypothetical protein
MSSLRSAALVLQRRALRRTLAIVQLLRNRFEGNRSGLADRRKEPRVVVAQSKQGREVVLVELAQLDRVLLRIFRVLGGNHPGAGIEIDVGAACRSLRPDDRRAAS